MTSLKRENRITESDKFDIVERFLNTLDSSPAEKMLRVVADYKNLDLFESCVWAGGFGEQFETFKNGCIMAFHRFDSDYALRLVFKGEPLAWSSFAMCGDSVGCDAACYEPGNYIGDVISENLFERRTCEFSEDSFTLFARFASPNYPDYSHEVYVSIDIESGLIFSTDCSTCRTWYDDDEDFDDCCKHVGTVVMAFLQDPHAFEGCPNTLEVADPGINPWKW